MIKLCPKCNVEQPIENFHKNNTRKDKHAAHCRACRNFYAKVWYGYNKEIQQERIRKSPTRLNNKKASRNLVMQTLLNNPCKDCGETDPIVLEFDHIGEKKYNVATICNGKYSTKTVQEEINKCEVVCANCHRRRTSKRGQFWRETYKL